MNDFESSFQIIEATNFKYLIHLSLTLLHGTNEEIISYLSSKISIVREDKENEEAKLQSEISVLTSSKCLVDEILAKTKVQLDNVLREKHNLEVNLLSEKNRITKDSETSYKKLEEDLKQKYESVIKQSKVEHALEVANLRDNVQTLKMDINEWSCKHSSLKSNADEIEKELTHLKSNYNLKSADFSTIKFQLDEQIRENENLREKMSDLTSENAKFHQTDSSKEEFIKNIKQDTSVLQEKLNSATSDLQKKSAKIEKLEKAMKTQSDEVVKANDIIKKLQSDIKTYHGKAKVRGQLATEQEKVLTTKESEIENLTSQNAQLHKRVDELTEELKANCKLYETSSQKLFEAEESLKMNEEIINWLNKKLSGTQIGQLQQCLVNRNDSQTIPTSSVSSELPMSTPYPLNGNIGPPKMASTNLPTSSSQEKHPAEYIPNFMNLNGKEGTSSTALVRAESSDTYSGRVKLSEADYLRDGYKKNYLTTSSGGKVVISANASRPTTSTAHDRMKSSDFVGDMHNMRTTNYIPPMSNNLLKIPYGFNMDHANREKVPTKSSKNLNSMDSTSKLISSSHHARFVDTDALSSENRILSQRYRPLQQNFFPQDLSSTESLNPMSKAYLQDEVASNSSCSVGKSNSILHQQSVSSAYFPIK